MKRIIGLFSQPILVGLVAILISAGSAGPARAAKHKTWREPLTGMEFVWVPGGCYEMGSPLTEKGRHANEGLPHKVCVNGFWIGKYEVTVGQFGAFVKATGYRTDAEKQGFSWIYDGKWIKKPGYTWRKPGFYQNNRHPVVNVSWNDAEAMAKWLTKHSKGHFVLPSEAQWEYACRGGTQTARFWGNNPAQACTYANVADLSAAKVFPAWTVHDCRDGYVYTAPVGSFQPNPFGLYDMIGNVWEWCADSYQSGEAYSEHHPDNPLYRNGSTSHVIRGGSWLSPPQNARCAARDHLQFADRRSYDLGFRLIRLP